MDMKIIARFKGMLGDIAIWENEADGNRLYLEGDIFQSHGSQAGETQLDYVKIMKFFLSETKNVLVLGCGGGNLATMLARSGKTVTVVDYNPISFQIARDYFGMPREIPCVTEDFRAYLGSESRCFDGIAIDVGGPGFCFEEQFDAATCHSIRNRLTSNGRVIMNILVGNDFDAVTDKIGNHLSNEHLTAWIIDHPGRLRRNALVTCFPKMPQTDKSGYFNELCSIGDVHWVPRRPRQRPKGQPRLISISQH